MGLRSMKTNGWIVRYTLWMLTLQGLTLAPWIIILWVVYTRVNTLNYQHIEFPQYCVIVKNHPFVTLMVFMVKSDRTPEIKHFFLELNQSIIFLLNHIFSFVF